MRKISLSHSFSCYCNSSEQISTITLIHCLIVCLYRNFRKEKKSRSQY
uniref:Uncharacterized protein n=1 Tax=Brugia timori TaxID=42155 RepID=A0A0R3QF65_9BILA